jgi:hypothetical protein
LSYGNLWFDLVASDTRTPTTRGLLGDGVADDRFLVGGVIFSS